MSADHDVESTTGAELPFWELVRREAADAARQEWERQQAAVRREVGDYLIERPPGWGGRQNSPNRC